MSKQEVKRSEAASFMDDVLKLIVKLEEDQVLQRDIPHRSVQLQATRDIANRLRTIASEHGLEVPRPCNGEAHSNMHIDNCGCCMGYDWGIAGKPVHIR